MHFTPNSSSWINQVELWFGFVTDQPVRCGSQSLAHALEKWSVAVRLVASM